MGLLKTTVEVNEDGLIVVKAPLETITLTRRQTEEIARKALGDALDPVVEAMSKTVKAIEAMPPEARAALLKML